MPSLLLTPYSETHSSTGWSQDKSVISSNPLLADLSTFIDLTQPLIIPTFGLLFAPGIGLFIFAPILLTIFFSFFDFFRKNKSDCILFLSFFALNIFFHTTVTSNWHGLVAWGPRYMIPMIPFLLIPLGASIEKRNKRLMFTIIIILGILGILVNFSYIVQDVSWFVWGAPGADVGLFGIASGSTPMYLHPNTIWTFQYSQLTHSILLMFEGLHHDIYLLHVFGNFMYVVLFGSAIGLTSTFYLLKISKKK